MGIYEDTMSELEACGTAQNRKVYRRHGAKGEQFGVSFANLNKLTKGRKGNNELAEQLWASGNHDARILAGKVANAKTFEPETMEAWADDLDNYMVADALGTLIASSPHAQGRHEAWKDDKREHVAQVAWRLLTYLAANAEDLGDNYFEQRLEQIEAEVHHKPNRVRYSMNMALIGVGGRNEHLRDLAFAAADRIGRVEVDHGDTGCKTADARPYIEKMWARKAAKG